MEYLGGHTNCNELDLVSFVRSDRSFLVSPLWHIEK